MKYIIIILTLLITSSKTETNQEFIGTWISEKDTNWKMIFTQTECTWYYENEITERYFYSVANSSPQCDLEVPVETHTTYLILTSKTDSQDKLCYEINGFVETIPGRKTLSIRPIGKGGFFLFLKQ